eukprot:CAMPEP_0194065266 /NCGR_PEP_ID=MMETSP0009_2-20130614/85271_1 /TAXON_ID=210454 /ORGANISM="Grammatophora oceanica, Strain CCMP 410" /LENGTH=71 /DNA_ID=CAMNT_0038718055 /DNA_START=320 /DNA_END=535 /DNA_ORIENTATION=-
MTRWTQTARSSSTFQWARVTTAHGFLVNEELRTISGVTMLVAMDEDDGGGRPRARSAASLSFRTGMDGWLL